MAHDKKSRLQIVIGDITKQNFDAIVNAANNSLLGGGGVDGAIHRAAGLQLLEECRLLNGCETGEAKITKGYKLPARYVIHTVGPIWRGGNNNESELLARCYRNCMEIAKEKHLRTIAFPSISTGIYGFPVDRASKIAIKEISAALGNNKSIENVTVVCFDEKTYAAYGKVVEGQDDEVLLT
jgi:O-acetyl-ADP-ribose deacetylase (regulator of RNase III)